MTAQDEQNISMFPQVHQDCSKKEFIKVVLRESRFMQADVRTKAIAAPRLMGLRKLILLVWRHLGEEC